MKTVLGWVVRPFVVLILVLSIAKPAWAGGAVSGFVSYRGDFPAPKRRPVTVDAAVCGPESVDESVSVGKRGALKNAVVFIQGRVEGASVFPEPDGGFVIKQKDCRFKPHVSIVAAGGIVSVSNEDRLGHSLKTISRTNVPQEIAQPKSLDRAQLRLSSPEIVELRCGIHDWKQAWIVVAEHPYYAVTDESGRFEMKDVPAGNYTLALWHEFFGLETRGIQVREGESTQIDWDPKRPHAFETPQEPWISQTASRLDVNVLPIQFVQWP